MILFVTSVAGPAFYIGLIIDALNEEFMCLSSQVSSKILNKYGERNRVVSLKDQVQYDQFIQNEYSDMGIDLIVTGTCWDNCIEKAAIKFGADNHIKVISIIEHWSFYKERFESGNMLRVPDYIIVNDELSKSQAMGHGLPEDIIFPLGNPVLEKRSVEPLSLTKERWRQALNIPDKKVVTFISEDYSGDFSINSPRYQGFDEYAVLKDILSAMTEEHHLVVKLHPQESAGKYAGYKAENISVFSEMDILPLTMYSDFIVGMGSMLLLEMATQRRDIVSYRPRDLSSFIGNARGATTLVTDRNELKEILGGRKKIDNFGIQDEFENSTNRIVNFIKGCLP